jgi:hypothetical protein
MRVEYVAHVIGLGNCKFCWFRCITILFGLL